jgi:hypothetical protein
MADESKFKPDPPGAKRTHPPGGCKCCSRWKQWSAAKLRDEKKKEFARGYALGKIEGRKEAEAKP